MLLCVHILHSLNPKIETEIDIPCGVADKKKHTEIQVKIAPEKSAKI